jgi:hypothetical protein
MAISGALVPISPVIGLDVALLAVENLLTNISRTTVQLYVQASTGLMSLDYR